MKQKWQIFIIYIILMLGWATLKYCVALGIVIIGTSFILQALVSRKGLIAYNDRDITIMDDIVILFVSLGTIYYANEIGDTEGIDQMLLFPILFLNHLTGKISLLLNAENDTSQSFPLHFVFRGIIVSWTVFLILTTALYIIIEREGVLTYFFASVLFVLAIGILALFMLARIYSNTTLYRELRIRYVTCFLLLLLWFSSSDFLFSLPTLVQLAYLSVLLLNIICLLVDKEPFFRKEKS